MIEVDAEGRGPTQRTLARERGLWEGRDVALESQSRFPNVSFTFVLAYSARTYLLHHCGFRLDKTFVASFLLFSSTTVVDAIHSAESCCFRLPEHSNTGRTVHLVVQSDLI